MRKIEIESWALRVIDQVERNEHSEDSRVELKSRWPDAEPAARQIAAMANAAHGAPILWLVGVDEVAGVQGADLNELSNWFSAVRKYFDSVYPVLLRDINVPTSKGTVVALLLETDRAPYLVRNPRFGKPDGGPVEWEVPWREARMTRSARREDVMRMLAPLIALPEIESLDLELGVQGLDTGTGSRWHLFGNIYVVPRTLERVVIPFHHCSLSVRLTNGPELTGLRDINLLAPKKNVLQEGPGGIQTRPDTHTVTTSSTEAIFNGPGRAEVLSLAEESFDVPVPRELSEATVQLRFGAVGVSTPVSLDVKLVRESDNFWRMPRPPRTRQ